MANLPLLSTTTLSTKDINLNVELDEKPLVEVNATIEKLNENLGNFVNELKVTVTGFNKKLEQNNKLLSENNKIIKEDSAKNLSKNLVSSNKDVLEKLNLNETFKNFNNTSYKKERSQSLFNLTPKQIAKDTLGSVKDMAMNKIMSNPVIKGFSNFKNAIGALRGGEIKNDSRKERTQEQIELDNEKIKREERTNKLLEDILKALLDTKEEKGVFSNLISSILPGGKSKSPFLNMLMDRLLPGIGSIAGAIGGLIGLNKLKNYIKSGKLSEFLDGIDLFNKKNKDDADRIKKTNSKPNHSKSLFDGFDEFNSNQKKNADRIEKTNKEKPGVFKRLANKLGFLKDNVDESGKIIEKTSKGGLFGNSGKLAKVFKIGGILTSLIGGVIDGFSSIENEWGDTSKISKFIGGFFAGPDGAGQLESMFFNGMKWAGIGAVAGTAIAPVIGTLLGGLAGFALGGLFQWIGGETIAKHADDFGNWMSKKWDSVMDGIKGFFNSIFEDERVTREKTTKATQSAAESATGGSATKEIDLTEKPPSSYNEAPPDYSEYLDQKNTGLPSVVPERIERVESNKSGADVSSFDGTGNLLGGNAEPTVRAFPPIPVGQNKITPPQLPPAAVKSKNIEQRKSFLTDEKAGIENLTPAKPYPNLSPDKVLPRPIIDKGSTQKNMERSINFLGFNNDKETKNIAFTLIAREEDAKLASGIKKVSVVMDDPGGTGSRSIGYGMNSIKGKDVSEIEKTVNGTYTITKEKADELLKDEIDIYHNELLNKKKKIDDTTIGNIYSKIKDPNKRATILSLAYQVGGPMIGNFVKMWKNINMANQLERAIFPTNAEEYWEKAGNELLVNGKGTGPSDIQKQLQDLQTVRFNEKGERVYQPTRMDRAKNTLMSGLIEAKDGYVSYKPTRLLTGEYPGARYNPELTVPLNIIKDEMVDATEKIISKVTKNYEKNPELTSIAVEQRITKTIEKAAEIQNRLKQKESMETSKIKMNVPIVNNNVVDNKQVTNNNQSLLMKQSSRNPQNIFRLD